MDRLMEEIADNIKEDQTHQSENGHFNSMGMMQQMDGNFYLGRSSVGETVSPVLMVS